MPSEQSNHRLRSLWYNLRGPSRTSKKLSAALPPSGELVNYEYTPLQGNEIRLIHLLPGAFEDDIHVRILHEELIPPDESQQAKPVSRREVQEALPEGWRARQAPEGHWWFWDPTKKKFTYTHPTLGTGFTSSSAVIDSDHVKYEALSYAWGDIARTRIAYIHSPPYLHSSHVHETKILRLTTNLDVALRHLRRANGSHRALWIDAISINQENDVERAAQIQRIPNIFKYAHRVVIWFGPEGDDSQLAMETLDFLGQQVEISIDGFGGAAPNAKHRDLFHINTVLPYTNSQWMALQALFKRPFFDRLWVLQEIVLANKNAICQCGSSAILWSKFRRSILVLYEKRRVPESILTAVDDKADIAYGLGSNTLHDVINISRSHLCSKPHDKVYGMMAFLGARLQQSIEPSYEKRFEIVFQDLFVEHSRISQRLDLLAYCFHGEDGGLDMPSWVPDIRRYYYKSLTSSAIYQAAGLSPASFEIVSNKILIAKGIVHGRVSRVLETAASEDDGDIAMKLDEILSESRLHASPITVGNDSIFLARLITTDETADRLPESSFTSLETFDAGLTYFLETKKASCSERLAKLDSTGTQYRRILHYMKFFVTKRGYCGFGSIKMKRDDFVSILLGLFTPLIIRPADDGTYKVVGWCYVPGLMDAEALLGPLPRGWKVVMSPMDNRRRPRYKNQINGEIQPDDPRLEPLSKEWQRIDQEITADDPTLVDFFENRTTGEIINYDPRMTAEALEQRNVKLDTIRLV